MSQVDADASLGGFPNISAAAEMLGVAASTLSRKADVSFEHRGDRDKVLSPTQVLRLAGHYSKRSLNEVAQDLVEYAERNAPSEADRIAEEVDLYFESLGSASAELAAFLAEARRRLPAELYREVEEAVNSERRETPPIVGVVPQRDRRKLRARDGRSTAAISGKRSKLANGRPTKRWRTAKHSAR